MRHINAPPSPQQRHSSRRSTSSSTSTCTMYNVQCHVVLSLFIGLAVRKYFCLTFLQFLHKVPSPDTPKQILAGINLLLCLCNRIDDTCICIMYVCFWMKCFFEINKTIWKKTDFYFSAMLVSAKLNKVRIQTMHFRPFVFTASSNLQYKF